MANPQIIKFIQEQSARGHNIETIKQYLTKYGYQINDINESINEITKPQLAGIESYIKQQISAGYAIDAISQFLISRGYNSELVYKAIENIAPKEKKVSKAMIITSLVILSLIFAGAIWYFTLTPDENGIYTTSTLNIVSTTKSNIPTTTKKISTTTIPGHTTNSFSTTTENIVTTTEETTATTFKFTPETAPLNEVLKQVKELGSFDPKAAEEYCKAVTKETFRDSCYYDLAKVSDKKEYCALIVKPMKLDSCYLTFAMKKDYEACEHINNAKLKQSCMALQKSEEQTQSAGPKISDVPDVEFEMNSEKTLNLNSYIDKTDSVWSSQGSINTITNFYPDGIAKISAKQDWSGAESVIFKACKNNICDSDNVKITVIKLFGFVLNSIPDITISKNTDYTLDLSAYINTQNAVLWKLPQSQYLVFNTNQNKILISPLKDWLGAETVIIAGCVNTDCDSKEVKVTVTDPALFEFMEIADIIINKNQVYNQIKLSDYVNKDNLDFTSNQPEHLSIAINENSIVTITPEENWIGKNEIKFTACEGTNCKEQIVSIEVV